MRRTICAPKRRTARWVPDQPGIMPRPVSGSADPHMLLGNTEIGASRKLDAASQCVAIENGD